MLMRILVTALFLIIALAQVIPASVSWCTQQHCSDSGFGLHICCQDLQVIQSTGTSHHNAHCCNPSPQPDPIKKKPTDTPTCCVDIDNGDIWALLPVAIEQLACLSFTSPHGSCHYVMSAVDTYLFHGRPFKEPDQLPPGLQEQQLTRLLI